MLAVAVGEANSRLPAERQRKLHKREAGECGAKKILMTKTNCAESLSDYNCVRNDRGKLQSAAASIEQTKTKKHFKCANKFETYAGYNAALAGRMPTFDKPMREVGHLGEERDRRQTENIGRAAAEHIPRQK